MANIEDDVADLGGDVADVEDFIDFLFDEQVIQDERIYSSEQRLLQVETEAENLEDSVIGKTHMYAYYCSTLFCIASRERLDCFASL